MIVDKLCQIVNRQDGRRGRRLFLRWFDYIMKAVREAVSGKMCFSVFCTILRDDRHEAKNSEDTMDFFPKVPYNRPEGTAFTYSVQAEERGDPAMSEHGKKQLTVWEASCIITGFGIGAGVMSIPYLTNKVGIIQAALIFAAVYAVNYVLHLMIADLAMKTEGGQIISCLSRFLFRGRARKFTWIFFVLIVFVLFCNLASYMIAGAEAIASLLSVSKMAGNIIFYCIAAAVVFFGLKVMGISEKIAVAIIFGLLAVLSIASLLGDHHPVKLFGGTLNQSLAFYGMAMFAISEFFSMPQVVQGLGHDKKKIKKATSIGFANAAIVMAVITFFTLLASDHLTEYAMVCWSESLGTWARILGDLVTILAMLTTYWSISLALGSIIGEQTHWSRNVCWVLATVPSLVITVLGVGSFMEIMRLAGGVISIIMAVMVIPSYHNARKEIPGSLLENGTNTVQILIVIGYILMGIGNVVPIG